MRSVGPRVVLPGAAALLGLLFLAGPAEAQANVAGIWNLQTRNVAMRATGGVRNILMRVEESGSELRAQMLTPLRNQFLDVAELELDGNSLVLHFGSYVYDLEVQGDRVTGTVLSPDRHPAGRGESTRKPHVRG